MNFEMQLGLQILVHSSFDQHQADSNLTHKASEDGYIGLKYVMQISANK
jgi:hypothetical protein